MQAALGDEIAELPALLAAEPSVVAGYLFGSFARGDAGPSSDVDVHRVLAGGRILFERDRSARIAFEVRVRNAYFDLLPVLREYRRQGGAAG